MPDQIDIANLDQWAGFRPGMTRAEVQEKLRQAGAEPKAYDDENQTAEVDDLYLEFWFEPGESGRLRQLAMDSDILWNGHKLMGLRLDDALRAFEPFDRPPMWDVRDATDDPFPGPGVTPTTGPVTDESLLEEGTVWLPTRGLGLSLWRGEVMEIVWRVPRDLPSQFAGPVTEAQRQLSKRPDLDDYLRSKKPGTAGSTTTPKSLGAIVSSILHTILVLVCLGMLAYIGRLGFTEMLRWNTAATLEGHFVSKENVPRKKYLDLAPEVIRSKMPDDPQRTREMYLVEYLDPTGRPQKATLDAGEFYIPPREPGEKVQIAYLAEDPPRVMGLSRVRDAAFGEYMPWAIAVGIFYVVAQAILRYLPGLLKLLLKSLVPKGDTVVIDRPELR
jgi:hypothetical protein